MREFHGNRQGGWVLTRLMGLVLIGVGLAIFMLSGLLFWAGLQTRIALQQAEDAARGQAERLEQRIAAIRAGMISDAFVEAAREDPDGRASLVAALRAHGVANVLDVIVADGRVEEVDVTGLPGGGFAALEMLIQADAGDRVPVQVHFADTADEYLAVAQALEPGAEDSAAALVTLPVSALSNSVQLPGGVGSMRLFQVMDDAEVMLERYGGTYSDTRDRIPIDGSLLELGWYKSTRVGPLTILQLSGLLAVGALTVLLGVLIVRRTRPLPAPSIPKRATDSTAHEPRREAAEDTPDDAAPVPEPATGRPIPAQPDDLTERMNETTEAGEQPAEPPTAAPAAAPAAPIIPPASIFRAYDIRGVVGDTLEPGIAEAVGRAVGSEARERGLERIAVARDGRLSGAELLASLTRGLQASGVDVVEVGAVPTPVLYYAAQELAGGSGVMVTGSHNPPDYNGFKIVLGGETLSGEQITGLHRRLEQQRLITGDGEVTTQTIASRYVERIASDIQLEKPLKVVADCGNGIAGAIAPRLLEAIGADVIPLYAEVDGTFPNHHPDPGDPETLEDLKLCVRNFDADLGVAFDGDGDRLGVVAPDGEIVYPDRLMMLFARDVLSRCPGEPVIFDVKCSSLLAAEIEAAGGRPVMARTGHSFIKARLKQEAAPLAGEMSGHFFFGERWYGFDDGMYAAARLLEILAADTRASGQILGTLPKAFSTPELKVEMKEGEPHPFVAEFRQRARLDGAEINDTDGVRADFADGFGLVRASNTTPVLVVRFEGTSQEALERIQQQFREAMLEVNPALKLPF